MIAELPGRRSLQVRWRVDVDLAYGHGVARAVPACREALDRLVGRFEPPTRRRSREEVGAHGEAEDVRPLREGAELHGGALNYRAV